jgi:hypothetical protein
MSEARQKYEKILASHPDHVDALVNLGTILFLSDAETAAASRFLQALAINPDHVEGNYNLANLLEGQGELDAAVLFYKGHQAEPVRRRPFQLPWSSGRKPRRPGTLAALPGMDPEQMGLSTAVGRGGSV